MPRYPTLLSVLVCVAGAGCSRAVSVTAPAAPAPAADLARADAPPAATVPANAVAARDSVLVPPAPPPSRAPIVRPPDRPTPADIAVDALDDRRLAADSAADEAALEELAVARPATPHAARDDADDADATTPAPASGAGALANAAVWDIDVTTFSDHDRVQYYLDFFGAKGRERMGIWLGRMSRYEVMIRERLLKEGLPGDLVYLALIESGFSNAATSRAKAVGMWQFMKGTARLYGLRIDSWVDERRDPYRATDAAARHLRDLTQRFGSVYLAAAAYNAGAGRVSRGLVKLPEDDDADSLTDATFFRLYNTKLLRRETKDYVPKLIAAALIAKQPERYGFTVTPESPVVYDSIIVSDMTGLDVIARLADTTVVAIRELNPQYLRRATPPGARSVVRLPAGRGPSTQLAYAELPPSRRLTSVDHVVERGETMSGIARRYHVSVDLLAQANPKINPRRLRFGQRLVVPTDGYVASASASASKPARSRSAKPVAARSSKRDSSSEAGRSVASATGKRPRANASDWHRVRRGETLSEIAEDYAVSVRDLRTWNRLGRTSQIRAGQRLRITPPSRAEAAPKGRTTEAPAPVASAGRYRAGGR